MFVWDPHKALANAQKHGISFEEAASVFDDPMALVFDDTKHSTVEQRSFRIGRSYTGRIVTVVYSLRSFHGQVHLREITRLISARQASRRERAAYRAAPAGR